MTQPRIIITRTQPGASQLAVRVSDMGLPVHITPVLCATPTHLPAPSDIFTASGLILTSPNGLRFAHMPARVNYDMRLYAVGEATGRFAREAGFTNVISGTGDIEGLGRILNAQHDPAQKLVHIRGAHVSQFTAGALAGFDITPWVTYDTQPDRHSLASIPKFLSMPGKYLIVLQSARAAGFVRECVQAYTDKRLRGDISILCMSPAVLESLKLEGLTGLYSCDVPSEDALLDAISRLSQNMMEAT